MCVSSFSVRVCWTTLYSLFPSRLVRMLRWTSTRDFLFPLAWSGSEWHLTTLKSRSVRWKVMLRCFIQCEGTTPLVNKFPICQTSNVTFFFLLACLTLIWCICLDSGAWQVVELSTSNNHLSQLKMCLYFCVEEQKCHHQTKDRAGGEKTEVKKESKYFLLVSTLLNCVFFSNRPLKSYSMLLLWHQVGLTAPRFVILQHPPAAFWIVAWWKHAGQWFQNARACCRIPGPVGECTSTAV